MEVSVCSFGAVGDGVTDCAAAIQAALDSGADTVRLPAGQYRVSHGLFVRSDTAVIADDGARVFLDGSRPRTQADHLLSTDFATHGCAHIRISGGIWDGGNAEPANAKPDDIFDLAGYSGILFFFRDVRDLVIENLTLANSTTYNVGLCETDGFRVEHIGFLSDRPGWNQDGIHVGGFCRHGLIRDIRALSYGQTNDDLIALNADDCVTRVENVSFLRGPIEDLLIEDVYAENCHTAIRMLSVTAPIRRVTVRRLTAGYRCYAVNLDGARYCRTPLFSEDDYPAGVGVIEDVHIEDMTVTPCAPANADDPAICLETRLSGFTLTGFRHERDDAFAGKPALLARNLPDATFTADGALYYLADKTDTVALDDLSSLSM